MYHWLSVLVILIHRSCSQAQVLDPSTTDDPCASQFPPGPGETFSDNLSCPRLDGILQCFPQEELCNGIAFCIGGTDEGLNLVSLDCDGSLSGRGVATFICIPDENIDIARLCDGVPDCSNGDDETIALCENKCLLPFAGGCIRLNRFCVSMVFESLCGECLPGHVPNPQGLIFPCIPIDSPVEFELQTSNEVREGDAPGFTSLCVELVTGELSSDVEVLINTISLTGGSTATVDVDYFITASTFTFTVGTQPGMPRSRLCRNILIVDDQLVEDTETITVLLTTVPFVPFSNGIRDSTISIVDNDMAVFRFTRSVYQQNENASPLTATLELVSGILTFNIFISVSTQQILGQQNTATDGVDYLMSSQFIFFEDFSPGSEEDISFVLLDDNIAEEIESFNIIATSQAPQAVFINPQVVGQILDDDVCQIGFEQSSSTVIEGSNNGMEEVCLVKLNTGIPVLETAVTVLVSTTSGNKTAGLDYVPLFSAITFQAGVPRMCVDLTLLDDDCVEPLECIQITAMSSNTGALQVVPNQAQNQFFTEVCCTDDDTIRVRLVQTEYKVTEEDLVVNVDIEAVGGQIKRPVSVIVDTFDSPPGPTSAEGFEDYFPITNTLVEFTDTMRLISVPVTIFNDFFCENDETFYISLTTFDSAVVLDPSMSNMHNGGKIIICDTDNVTVQSTQPSYTVNEGETVHIDIEYLLGPTQIVRTCIVTVTTMDRSAISTSQWRDYFALPVTTFTFDNSTSTFESIYINVCDDSKCEGDEEFEVILSTYSDGCTVGNNPIPVTIIDDEVDTHGLGDDPHFSIALPSGELLCYTVQGEHGFSFNLISNHKMAMNAKFVPDAHREEVTWLGSIGIIVKNTNYKGSNETKLRFDVDTKSIHIGDKVQLEARNIEKLTFSNGKLIISEAPPQEGFHYPSVYVDLEDVQLQFTIKYTNQHLDIYWHSTGGRLADSHGLIGQFFRKGVEIDEVRKILIMPNKEPIPVMRRPVWSFMEREMPDEQLCWTAMNPGYQGEGLIDGTYFDYLVDNVLSTDLKQ